MTFADRLWHIFFTITGAFWSDMHPSAQAARMSQPPLSVPDLNDDPTLLLTAKSGDVVMLDGIYCEVDTVASDARIFLTTADSNFAAMQRDSDDREYLWVHVRHTDPSGTGALWTRRELAEAIQKQDGQYNFS